MTFPNNTPDHQVETAMELTVVMPCLDEAETLATCILKAQKWMKENSVRGEVLIADNGSTDGSQRIAADLGARVVAIQDKGYGNALRGGISAAKGRYIIMGDSDDSYDFSNLTLFVTQLRNGYDLVMGNRFKGGIAQGAMPPLHKFLGNPVLTIIGRLFFHSPCGDFHCGLRGFKKSSAEKMDLRTSGMEFASEMVIKATLLDMKICEVPTTLSPDGRTRSPHLRSWRDGWRHLRFMLLYSTNWLFFYPGIFLMFTGLIAGARLIVAPLSIGSVVFDVHTLLLMATAIIIGYQSLLFAVFSKTFAVGAGLIPARSSIAKMVQYIKLETGICTGLFLVVAGLSGILYSFFSWQQSSFGPLSPSTALRVVIPSITATIIGFQTILGSFFLSVLSLSRKANQG